MRPVSADHGSPKPPRQRIDWRMPAGGHHRQFHRRAAPRCHHVAGEPRSLQHHRQHYLPDGSSNIRLTCPKHSVISGNTISIYYNGMVELPPNSNGDTGNGNVISGNVISVESFKDNSNTIIANDMIPIGPA